MLLRYVPTHGGVLDLVGCREAEDIRGARHTPGGGAGAVTDGELLKVQSEVMRSYQLLNVYHCALYYYSV